MTYLGRIFCIRIRYTRHHGKEKIIGKDLFSVTAWVVEESQDRLRPKHLIHHSRREAVGLDRYFPSYPRPVNFILAGHFIFYGYLSIELIVFLIASNIL